MEGGAGGRTWENVVSEAASRRSLSARFQRRSDRSEESKVILASNRNRGGDGDLCFGAR
jgi:hypothetical protein